MSREFGRCLLMACALLAACDEAPEPKGPYALPEVPAFAVVSSDFTSTSISLLDGDGALLADNYVSSGSTRVGLTTALSGDVAVPTHSGQGDVLTILDRFRNDVVTRIAMPSGEILGQVRTHGEPAAGSASAYSSNPQDYVYIDEQSAWVSRYEPNLDPSVPLAERGTDLLRIEPSTMTRTGDRIDLAFLDSTGSRTNPDTGAEEEVKVHARPASIVRVGDTLVVGLSLAAFDFSAVGEGAVALVDLNTKSAVGFALEGLQSCAEVVPVIDQPTHVLVGCTGFYLGGPHEKAGIVELSITGGKARVERQWRASEHAEQPSAVADLVSLGAGRVGAVAFGQSEIPASEDFPAVPAAPDQFVVIDLGKGTQTVLFESDTPYAIGYGFFAAESGLLLVPDAATDKDLRPTQGVHRFRLDETGAFKELGTIKVADDLALPARQVRAL
jgi:hypothetical protein